MPETLDIDIVRGDTFSLTLEFQDGDGEPIDLSAYTYRAQVRLDADSGEAWDITINDTDADMGVLTLSMLPAVTASIDGSGVWDLEQTDDTDVVATLVQGDAVLLKDVSR